MAVNIEHCKSEVDKCPVHSNSNSRVKELDDYFCSLLNTISPDIYFGKLLNIPSDGGENSGQDKSDASVSHVKHSKRDGQRSKIFRRATDGSIIPITEVYSEEILDILKKKNTKNVLGRGINKEALLEKLHCKLGATQHKSAASRKRKDSRETKKERKKRAKLQAVKQAKNERHKFLESTKSESALQNVDASGTNRKMAFNKFSVVSGNLSDSLGLKKKSDKNKGIVGKGNKKYDELIKIAEKKQKKLNELKDVDPQKAKDRVSQQQWGSAVMKAQGMKVKDDINLLKRAAKRREKQKEKSTKSWEKRKQDQMNRVGEKQRVRKENISKKKQEKLQKKKKKEAKKGRIFVDVNN